MPATATVSAPPAASSSAQPTPCRRFGAFIAKNSRRIIVSVRATAARVERYVGATLAIPPSAVLPLVLVALWIVALALAHRA